MQSENHSRHNTPEVLLQLEGNEKQPLYRQIAEQLKRYIIDHRLHPGDKLPTEYELMNSFGVSRSSIREALRFLQSIGIVQIRQRHGVVIQEPELEDLMNQLAYGMQFMPEPESQLWEARLVLETGALPLICARVNSNKLNELDTILAAMEGNIFSAQAYSELDMRFHRSLLYLSGNRVVLELARVIEDFFSHPRNQVEVTPSERRLFTQEHWLLRNCIASGHAGAAQDVLWKHLWRYHAVWGKGRCVQPDQPLDQPDE